MSDFYCRRMVFAISWSRCWRRLIATGVFSVVGVVNRKITELTQISIVRSDVCIASGPTQKLPVVP
jgi:hypothetical protein